jgi:hypothetical protein
LSYSEGLELGRWQKWEGERRVNTGIRSHVAGDHSQAAAALTNATSAPASLFLAAWSSGLVFLFNALTAIISIYFLSPYPTIFFLLPFHLLLFYSNP